MFFATYGESVVYTESRFQSFVKKVVFMSLQVWNDDAMYWIRGTSACLAVVIKSKKCVSCGAAFSVLLIR